MGYRWRKIAWIEWKTLCRSKGKGDFYIEDLNLFNVTLLAKCMIQNRREFGRMCQIQNMVYGEAWTIERVNLDGGTMICGFGEERIWFEENVT